MTRYVDDGNVVSSGAVMSRLDAALHVVRRLAGDFVTRRVIRELGCPYRRFLDAGRQGGDPD